jgi:hypothetical protein
MKKIKNFNNFFSGKEIWLAGKDRGFSRQEFDRLSQIFRERTGSNVELSFTIDNLKMLLSYFGE